MQIPESMRKSVVFLYYRRGEDLFPAGTAFLVGQEIPGHPDYVMGLLLTAHHVIAGIRSYSDDGLVYIRANTTDGDSKAFTASIDDWVHVRRDVDCAMLRWNPPDEVDYQGWNLSSSATDDAMTAEAIGIGDEVFIVGLFRNHLGRDRIEPIVRVGNIAAVPADPIQASPYGEMRAILVEARSIGGLSGSPVFVHMGYARFREGQVMTYRPEAGIAGPFMLLGLMHGHWDALESEVDSFHGQEKINMGIGIVVPIQEILDSLKPWLAEALEAERSRLDAEAAKSPE